MVGDLITKLVPHLATFTSFNRVPESPISKKKTVRVAYLASRLAADRNQSPDPLSVSAVTPPAILRRPKRALVKAEEIDSPDGATAESDFNDSSSNISEEPPRSEDGEWVSTHTLKSVVGHPHAYRYKKAKTPFDIEEVIATRKAERKANTAETKAFENISAEDGAVFFLAEEATPPPEQMPDYHAGTLPDSSHTFAAQMSSLSRSPVIPGDKQTLGGRKATAWEIHRKFLRVQAAQRDEAQRMAAVIAQGEDVIWG
ncbi:hypothetical protein BDP81DRAFT_400784 [Colletotrichum phormii]|uniref:Uncharacterized protein n=1 Tax=Colletotrichum phormii TaxID=359342 RepID=A0AAI9ZC95_9PEZI|nr:uncharacterized protein BDP81DRAFT_400784 [Colletotrichum phormii]KAK1621882.1 hypothetical protein BDP81DRAFT_400784 [Colletotrichum phormii]